MLTILIIVLGYFALRFAWHLTRPVAVIEPPPAPTPIVIVTPATHPPLFPGYAFVTIELQWHARTGLLERSAWC
jgi:hypothetical protein